MISCKIGMLAMCMNIRKNISHIMTLMFANRYVSYIIHHDSEIIKYTAIENVCKHKLMHKVQKNIDMVCAVVVYSFQVTR